MTNEPEINETPDDPESPEALEALRQQVAAAEAGRLEAERKLAALKAKLEQEAIDHELWRHSHGKMEYPAIVARLIDRTAIVYDQATGEVSGAKEAVDALLLGNKGLAAGRSNGPGSPAAMRVKPGRTSPFYANGTPPPPPPRLRLDGYDFM